MEPHRMTVAANTSAMRMDAVIRLANLLGAGRDNRVPSFVLASNYISDFRFESQGVLQKNICVARPLSRIVRQFSATIGKRIHISSLLFCAKLGTLLFDEIKGAARK